MPPTPSSGSAHFDQFRDRLAHEQAVRRELEGAMRLNVDRVDPSDPGNRFVVGGAIEWLIAAAAWSLGVLTIPGGHIARGFDLLDLQQASRGLWSVKAQTARKAGAFRITNGQGGAGKGLVDPTVFVGPNLPGMVLVHPDHHADVVAEVKFGSDSTTLAHGEVKKHALSRSECVIPLDAPINENRGRENPFLAYAETIVTPSQFPRLSGMFTAAKPVSAGTAAEVAELAAMRDAGTITQDQFNDLIGLIINN